MLGTDLDGPTCGEHEALVNPVHAGTKAMDAVMHGWKIGMTHEEILLDCGKSKALLLAVGWNASPVGASICAMSKYCALNSDKGSALARSTWATSSTPSKWKCFKQRMERKPEAAALKRLELIGRADDLLFIKGSRAYASAMNAPEVDRLLQAVQGSFLRFIEENKTLAKGKAPSKIADQIIAGAHTPEIIACVRAEAIIGDFYIVHVADAAGDQASAAGVPDGSERHILDIGPVYEEAYKTSSTTRNTLVS